MLSSQQGGHEISWRSSGERAALLLFVGPLALDSTSSRLCGNSLNALQQLYWISAGSALDNSRP